MAVLDKQKEATAQAIGAMVAKAREASGLSQTKFANALSKPDGKPWHMTYVGNVERGERLPSQMFMVSLANYSGGKPEDYLPEGVAMSDLSEGVERAPRGSRRATRTATTHGAEASAPAATKPKAETNGTVGLSLEGGILTIVLENSKLTVEGDFDARIVNGRLALI